jgi:hypothetical protein
MKIQSRHKWAIVPVFAISFFIGPILSRAASPTAQEIRLDLAGPGRMFEGIGAVSAGASSRLLIDYPEPQRSQILDYLFKPRYGASLQHLKVEIGGDINSTDGAEPSHMRSQTDRNFHRGYEWWLLKEAKKRNPKILLDALEWGAPGWIGNGNFFSRDNIDYLVQFLKGAREAHGLNIDYIGIWNETKFDPLWIKQLKQELRKQMIFTQVVAADMVNDWSIAEAKRSDKELYEAVDRIGVHYVGKKWENNGFMEEDPRCDTPDWVQGMDKILWASEDGPWRGDWPGARFLAMIYNRHYLNGRMVKTEIWSPVTSYYNVLPLPKSGLMLANEPWSGHYEVLPAIWATAHTTQFAAPGWQYLDAACTHLRGGGSLIALVSPDRRDFSVIVETIQAKEPQSLTLQLPESHRLQPLWVWQTTQSQPFLQKQKIQPILGQATLELDPGSLYSITTTTGQKKGSASSPPSRPFPLPYAESFEGRPKDGTPPFWQDQNGAFEIAPYAGNRTGQCLEQKINLPPIRWHFVGDTQPMSILGNESWQDYQISAEVFWLEPGAIKLMGRFNLQHQQTGQSDAYQFYLEEKGGWSLRCGNDRILASGTVQLPAATWQRLTLQFQGEQIRASLNGRPLCFLRDNTVSHGLAGLGVGGWTRAQFDNIKVAPLPYFPGGWLNILLIQSQQRSTACGYYFWR